MTDEKASVGKMIEIGMGATQAMHSDRHAFTVVRVSPSGKTVWVQQDRAIRTDENGMSDSQTYEFSPDPSAPEIMLRRTKRGWHSRTHGRFVVGERSEHYDYSF